MVVKQAKQTAIHKDAEAIIAAAFEDVPGVTVKIHEPGDVLARSFEDGWNEAVRQLHDHPDGALLDCEDCPPDLDRLLDVDRVWVLMQQVFFEVDFRYVPLGRVHDFVRRLRRGLNWTEGLDAEPQGAEGGEGEPDAVEGVHVRGDGGRVDADGRGADGPEGRGVGEPVVEPDGATGGPGDTNLSGVS